MKPQPPAEGICSKHNYTGWRYYSVPCVCGCDNKVEISIEVDEPDDPHVTCHIACQVKTAHWRETFPITYTEMYGLMGLKVLANDAIRRLEVCWTALTKGYVQMESYTLLSKQQALNMGTVILKATEELEFEHAKQNLRTKKVQTTDTTEQT